MQTAKNKIIDGSRAAVYYKYFTQYNNPYIVHKLPLKRISAKCLYSKNKLLFDRFALLFNTYKIDAVKYLKFLVFSCGKTEKDVSSVLLSKIYMSRFIDYLRIQSQYNKIYKWFMKSANNIANDCIRLGFNSTKEYMRYLISNRMLVSKYLAGKISIYYLSAIQNFKKIIPKLDAISQAEFSKILNRYDKYNSDVQEAFKKYKSCRVNPIKFTDDLLWKKLNKK